MVVTGFNRDPKYHQSLQDEHGRQVGAQSVALGASVHMSSALGESFMVLKPPALGSAPRAAPTVGNTTGSSVGIASHNELKVFASSPPSQTSSSGAASATTGVVLSGEPVVSAYGGGSSVKIKNLVGVGSALPAAQVSVRPGSFNGSFGSKGSASAPSSGSAATWTDAVLTWGGFGANATGNDAGGAKNAGVLLDGGEVRAEPRDELAPLRWNEQSVLLPPHNPNRHSASSSSGFRQPSPDPRGSGHAIASAVLDDLTRSTMSSGSADSETHSAAGVANLLQTVNRLGELHCAICAVGPVTTSRRRGERAAAESHRAPRPRGGAAAAHGERGGGLQTGALHCCAVLYV